jgi:hypothetical protein
MKIVRETDHVLISVKASLDKVEFNAEFIRRIFNLSVWLKERYGIEYDDCSYEHGFEDDDALNKQLTIRLLFHGADE